MKVSFAADKWSMKCRCWIFSYQVAQIIFSEFGGWQMFAGIDERCLVIFIVWFAAFQFMVFLVEF